MRLVPLLCFSLGVIIGLRSLTAPAVVCWFAHLGRLNLAESKLAFVGNRPTLLLFSVLAIAELIADKLPTIPARTQPVGLIARVAMGGLCGAIIAVSVKRPLLLARSAGVAGAVAGAFAGYNLRQQVVLRAHVPDFVVAVTEDVIAIAGSLAIVWLVT